MHNSSNPGRPRKINHNLPTGLYCYPGRNCYIRIGESKPVTLPTKNHKEALVIYWAFQEKWAATQAKKKAESLTARLIASATNVEIIPISDYARKWRETYLPKLLKANGKPLGEKTRGDYARMLKGQVEKHEVFSTLAVSELRVGDCRIFLDKWIESPSFYNYMKSLLSRVVQFAVDQGKLEVNPLDQVNRRPVAKREVYMSNKDFQAITAAMCERDRLACELLYMVSHRPADVLSLREDQVQDGILKFTAGKNDVDMEIEINDDLAGVIQSLKDWKAESQIVSPYLAVYDAGSKRRHIGKPLSVGYLSHAFAAAVGAAGFVKGKYTLRDIRPKGLSDEYVIAGENNKGGHKTEAMKQRYRRVRVPVRAKNNLRLIRE